MRSQLADVAGAQRPRILTAPEASSSAGQEAVDLAAAAGLKLDPWQQLTLQQALGERPNGQWAAFEVGLVVARQNGKGSILEARELAGLYLFGERLILHSAHQFDTALEAFYRVLQLIEETPFLDSKVKRISRAHGEEGVELKNGSRLRFKARTARGGRGFSGDLVILDEAMYLPTAAMSALLPTMSARPNPQLWYTGSAVDVSEHEHGHTLAAVRQRGISGTDPSLCYLEWSPDVGERHPDDLTDAELDDPELWAQANPGIGIRISAEHVAKERRSMLRRSFAVERLSAGVWPRPDDLNRVVAADTWTGLLDEASQPGPVVAFGVDVAPDRSHVVLAVASRRPDGYLHVEVIDSETGTGWVVDRLVELVARWDPCAVVIDQRSGAMSLEADLLAEEIEPDVTSARDMATATGEVHDAIHHDRLRHLGQSDLDDAVAAARTRPLGDAFAWDRRGTTPITALVAVTLACWGVVHRGSIVAPPPPQSIPADASERTAVTGDLMSAGF